MGEPPGRECRDGRAGRAVSRGTFVLARDRGDSNTVSLARHARARRLPWVARSPSATAPDGYPTLSAWSHPRVERCPSIDAVGGLRMTQGFEHVPVMATEVVEMFEPVPPGLFVDATVGGGGHAELLLKRSSERELIGLDRDSDAIAATAARLAPFGVRVRLHRARFDEIAEIVSAESPGRPVVGVLFDLGVSSPQLDDPDRGFSYRSDGPLDMRMDRSTGVTASEFVNSVDVRELTALLIENGEGRFGRRIAEAIVASRPIETTAELSGVVERALPGIALRRAGHPAKRVFQALRVAVNEELDVLGPAIDAALGLLVPGGRCVVLSYHSGEDRLVKQRFAFAGTGGCTCPPELGCVCGAVPTVRVLTRGAKLPTASEVSRNPRASSARLRAAERLPLEGP
jgi:16S rRNA (cytosine1402-N4)-methyltransferase